MNDNGDSFDFPRNFGRENLVSLSVVATRKIVKIVVREINDFRSENLINKVSRVRPRVPFTVLGTQFRLTHFVFRRVTPSRSNRG